jgi:Tfp pilus assembly major pilin PilA
MMKRSFTKTMLTNATPINKNAKILALRLWSKLDSQQLVIDRSTVEENDSIPPYHDPLY